jgi:hypothetical protein
MLLTRLSACKGIVFQVLPPLLPTAEQAANPDGVGKKFPIHLEVFSFGTQGAYWHIWQQVSGGSWSPWTQFDTPTDLSVQSSDLTTAQDADGRLVVFFRDSGGVLWYTS